MLLDTSALVAIFTSKKAADRIEREVKDTELYISHVQIAELADWATRSGVPAADRIDSVEQMVNVAPLTNEICLGAASIKSMRRSQGISSFGIVDGIILSTARSLGQSLLTFDTDFEGEPDCVVMR